MCVREVVGKTTLRGNVGQQSLDLKHTSSLLVNICKPTLLVGRLNYEARKRALTLTRGVLWGAEPGAGLGLRGVTPVELQSTPKRLGALTTQCSRRGW